MFDKVFNNINLSIKDITGRVSSGKISSYFILGSILTSSAAFILIDIVNAIVSWRLGNTYTIPIEHIGIFALILSHHLVLLGIKNASDKTKIEKGYFEYQGGMTSNTSDNSNTTNNNNNTPINNPVDNTSNDGNTEAIDGGEA